MRTIIHRTHDETSFVEPFRTALSRSRPPLVIVCGASNYLGSAAYQARYDLLLLMADCARGKTMRLA
jgi:hypothetical protein